MPEGGVFGLEIDGGEIVHGHEPAIQRADVKRADLLGFVAVFHPQPDDDRHQMVAFAQFRDFQSVKRGLREPADLRVVDRQRVGAFLIDVNLQRGHAAAEIIVNLVTARGPERGGDRIGFLAQHVEVVAA